MEEEEEKSKKPTATTKTTGSKCERPEFWILVGKSGSGKTTAAKELVADSGLPVHVVNGQPDDYGEGYRDASWEDCSSLRDCCLIVDDVLSCSGAEFRTLQRVANFSGHHLNIKKLLVLTHSIQNTHVHGLLAYATHVVFTLSKTNARSLSVTLDFYKFGEEKKAIMREFNSCGDEYGYYVLHVERRTFARPPGQVSRPRREETAREPAAQGPSSLPAQRFLELLAPEARRRQATLIFDLVYPHLPRSSDEDGDDFTIVLRSKATGETVRTNIFDYLDCITSEKGSPSPTMLGLHNYVTGLVSIPRCFVANKRFLKKDKR
jgi:hypothetical protein